MRDGSIAIKNKLLSIKGKGKGELKREEKN